MKALLRWMPLSIAAHAVAIGAGTYVVRSALDSALFVDLTLEDAGRGGDQRPAGAAAPLSVTPRGPARPARPGGTATASRAIAPTPPSPPRAESPPATAPAPPSTEMATPPETPSPPVVSPPAFPTPMMSESTAPPDPSALSGPGGGESKTGAGAEMQTGQGGGLGGAERDAAAGGAGKGTAGSGEGRGEGRVALAVPGDAGADAYGPYLAMLRQRIQDTLTYPPGARRRGLSGTVNLEISIDARGRVSDVIVVRSSSHAMLDDAAVDAARGLRRIPFPPDVRPRALRVRLPVKFELH